MNFPDCVNFSASIEWNQMVLMLPKTVLCSPKCDSLNCNWRRADGSSCRWDATEFWCWQCCWWWNEGKWKFLKFNKCFHWNFLDFLMTLHCRGMSEIVKLFCTFSSFSHEWEEKRELETRYHMAEEIFNIKLDTKFCFAPVLIMP